MTEFGELSAAALDDARRGRCPMCGERHEMSSSDAPPPPVKAGARGWKRGEALSPRNAAREGDEMHHCVAFSAFSVGPEGAQRDFLPSLNARLRKEGYAPNRSHNCVALPGRAHPEGRYGRFWDRLDAGAPLQLHLGRHRSAALNASKAMVLYVLRYFAENPGACPDAPGEAQEGGAEALLSMAEDLACHRTLRYAEPFRLHPTRLDEACAGYLLRRGDARPGALLAKELTTAWSRADTGVALEGNPFARAGDVV